MRSEVGEEAAGDLRDGIADDGIFSLSIVVACDPVVEKEVAVRKVGCIQVRIVGVLDALSVDGIDAGPLVAVEGSGGFALPVDELSSAVTAGRVVPDDFLTAVEALDRGLDEGRVQSGRE